MTEIVGITEMNAQYRAPTGDFGRNQRSFPRESRHFESTATELMLYCCDLTVVIRLLKYSLSLKLEAAVFHCY
ncbi:hypothetical protein [Paenibacillus sp. S150]|uniref:hypothetical protein n=1 Tax=Paenibacillus sp. S150 TaxID=2749826 RepID=UPI001C591CB7|nr:hypothetical protein [Paenibacillus sp. S150]MBW4081913.1 hypothetical protein [Paenibacillus sp. S150]